jgi:hypothetical protein
MEPVREGIYTKIGVLIAALAFIASLYYYSHSSIPAPPNPVASSPASSDCSSAKCSTRRAVTNYCHRSLHFLVYRRTSVAKPGERTGQICCP